MHNAINILLVSIPEEMFLTVMTLILLKRFDMLDVRMWRKNLKWITIPVLTISILMNSFTYIIPEGIAKIIVLVIFYILLVYIIKRNSYSFMRKDYWKILFSLSFSFFILGLIEGLTIPLVLFLLHKPLSFLVENGVWNFLASCPSRILEFLIIIFAIVKHNNVVKIRLFDIIAKNNFLLSSMIIFMVASNVFAVFVIKLIGFDRILKDISMTAQMIISMSVLVIPAIILFWGLLLINYLTVKEKQIQQTYENLATQENISFDVQDN